MGEDNFPATLTEQDPRGHRLVGAGRVDGRSEPRRARRAAACSCSPVRPRALVVRSDADARRPRAPRPPPSPCPSSSCRASRAAPGDAAAGRPQPEAHLRELRRRPVEPARARGRARGGGRRRPPLQPALHLRRHRARQDAPHARDRAPRARGAAGRAHRLRVGGAVHERVHHGHPAPPDGRVPRALPVELRRAAGRRHPVPGRPRADAGGVLPHLQRAPRARPADRGHERQVPAAARAHGGAARVALLVGPRRRHPGAGARDARRDRAQQGGARGHRARRTTWRSTSRRWSGPTSASSRGR